MGPERRAAVAAGIGARLGLEEERRELGEMQDGGSTP
jgi:hypothetical protein